MAHNGTLSRYKGNTDESDTRRFVKQFVRPLFKRLRRGMDVADILNDDFTKFLLENELSTMSVLSFIDGDGNTLNCNATGNGGFTDDDGVYYSNKYSFDEDYRKPNYGYGYTTPGYYNPPAAKKKEVTKPNSPFDQRKFAVDTKVQKFSEVYSIYPDDLLEVTDDFIDFIVDNHPRDAKLLIKELVCEWQKLSDRTTQ